MTIEIGNKGWLKTQGSLVLDMQEIQPNWVYNGSGSLVAVDGASATRSFSGYEGAITVDFAKAFDAADKTYQMAFDLKNEQTNLGGGLTPYIVNSFIGAIDFNPPVPGFDSLVLSGAYEYAQSTGSEYTLTGQGNPLSLASYNYIGNTTAIGSYAYQALNVTKNSWVLGFMYPLSKTVQFHGDYFVNQYQWTDVANYSRWEDIWRFTYEARF